MTDHTDAMSARMQEAWEKRQDAPQVILAKWKTWPILRMLWSVYREARRAYFEDAEQWDAIIAGLPVKFQKRIAKVQRKAKDNAWFNYMELPDIVKQMHAASVLAPVFDVSIWTKADRVTLAGCEDIQAVDIGWENLLYELQEAGVPVSAEAKSFDWRHFNMTETRTVMRLVSLLLDSADSPG